MVNGICVWSVPNGSGISLGLEKCEGGGGAVDGGVLVVKSMETLSYG